MKKKKGALWTTRPDDFDCSWCAAWRGLVTSTATQLWARLWERKEWHLPSAFWDHHIQPEVRQLAPFERPWKTRLISALTSGFHPALKLPRPEVHGWCTHFLQHSGSSIWNDIGLHKCHCLSGLMKSNACAAFTSWGHFLCHDGGAASVSLYTVSYRNKMYCHILGVQESKSVHSRRSVHSHVTWKPLRVPLWSQCHS